MEAFQDMDVCTCIYQLQIPLTTMVVVVQLVPTLVFEEPVRPHRHQHVGDGPGGRDLDSVVSSDCKVPSMLTATTGASSWRSCAKK